MDCSLPGSSVQVSLQARILEWVAMPFKAKQIPSYFSFLLFIIFFVFLGHLFLHTHFKNHFIYFKDKVSSQENLQFANCCCSCLATKSFLTPCNPMDCSLAEILCPCSFPGKNTRVGCHFLLQEFFLPHGWNLHILLLLHWQVDSLPLSHPRSPNIDCSLNRSIVLMLNFLNMITVLCSRMIIKSWLWETHTEVIRDKGEGCMFESTLRWFKKSSI